MLRSKLPRPLPPRVQPMFSFPSRRRVATSCECTAGAQRREGESRNDFIARVQCDCTSGLKYVLGVAPGGVESRA